MSDTLRFAIAAILMAGGILSAAVSILGVYRFRFVMNRMHCAAILDTVSMALLFLGLMVSGHSMAYTPKLLAALIVLWVTSPAASHLVSHMERTADDTAGSHFEIREEDTDGSH